MGDPNDWMWANALAMVSRAERLHRQVFRPSVGQSAHPRWEPPVDVVETAEGVVIVAALPGVRESEVEITLDGPLLVITGDRTWPAGLRPARIHRLELPQGRFERRIALPAGRYDRVGRRFVDGCLVIQMRKLG